MDSIEATGGDGRMIYSWRFPIISAAQFFAVMLALCISVPAATAVSETHAVDSSAEAEQPLLHDADALLRVSVDEWSQWDEARCEAALALLADVLGELEKRLPALRKEQEALRESLLHEGAYRRRLRRVQAAQEEYRELKAALKRNLERDAAVKAMDGAMKALDALWLRLEVRISLVQDRLQALAKETDEKRSETIRPDFAALEDAEAASRAGRHDIARWAADDCKTVQALMQAHMEAIEKQRRPALWNEILELKASLRAGDGYDRQRRDVERAEKRFAELNNDLEERLNRNRQLKEISNNYRKTEEQSRQFRMLRTRLFNRLRYIRLVESRERSGEPTPNVGG